MTDQVLPVFVYGSLRKGFWNYEALLQGNTVKEVRAEIVGNLHEAYAGGFPALLEGSHLVKGELMYLDGFKYDILMRRLDRLEGYKEYDLENSMYIRECRTVWDSVNDKEVKAWVYIWNRKIVGKLIESGCYAEHKKNDAWEHGIL